MANCNAGHGCRIRCPAGCGAVYVLPRGPCITWCEPSSPNLNALEEAKSFSVDIHDMPVGRFQEILEVHGGEEIRELVGRGDRKITLSMESTDLPQFIQAVAKQLR